MASGELIRTTAPFIPARLLLLEQSVRELVPTAKVMNVNRATVEGEGTYMDGN